MPHLPDYPVFIDSCEVMRLLDCGRGKFEYLITSDALWPTLASPKKRRFRLADVLRLRDDLTREQQGRQLKLAEVA